MQLVKFLGYLFVLFLVVQSIMMFVAAAKIGSMVPGGEPSGYGVAGGVLGAALIVGLLVRKYL